VTLVAAVGPGQALVGLQLPLGADPLGQAWQSGEVMVCDNTAEDPSFHQWPLGRNLTAGRLDFACAPLKTADGTIGLLQLTGRAQPWRAAEIRLLRSIAEMIGNALHRAALHEQTRQRLQRLQALRTIGNAISASLDLEVTLRLLLEQVTGQLRLDAAAILLFEAGPQQLRYAAGHGFRTLALQRTVLQLGEGYAGRSARERRIVNIPDLRRRQTDFLRLPLFAAEGFVAYYAVPLVAKGQLRGVLEIFHRGPVAPDPEWLSFLEGLAAQAAIALDNAALFQALQRSNLELARSYEATLEGWVKALELRDQETTGHTQRVTQMTLQLSRVLGVAEADLVHIRRGAWLHDIGKMAIPDHILRKPGPLSAEEWVVMRQHPVLARDLLNPIPYLQPALAIPYSHHEKWDGSGYPEGLGGERIPTAARIFAVVDVWDALRSDRPYRRAWREETVRQYLRDQARQHFDPEIVSAFLQTLEHIPA
jgi:putative nucleotidyltransferase with HDIG domain